MFVEQLRRAVEASPRAELAKVSALLWKAYAAGQVTELKRDGHHIMLLQTRQKLAEGETFTCSVVFQAAGTRETEVRVTRSP